MMGEGGSRGVRERRGGEGGMGEGWGREGGGRKQRGACPLDAPPLFHVFSFSALLNFSVFKSP